MRQSLLITIAFVLILPTLNQRVLTNISFECQSLHDGFWRDLRYCDVFHVCVAEELKRSYGCPQLGDRFYFDDLTQRCEFASRNAGGCQSNQYYTPVTNATTVPSTQTTTNQTSAGNQGGSSNTAGTFTGNSNVSCNGQPDGAFFSSRFCNVYHRCVSGQRFDIRCPRANNVPYDLWWNQQTQLCDWPCRIQCNNPLYASSMSAQQVFNDSLAFFNNDCRDYPPAFN